MAQTVTEEKLSMNGSVKNLWTLEPYTVEITF